MNDNNLIIKIGANVNGLKKGMSVAKAGIAAVAVVVGAAALAAADAVKEFSKFEKSFSNVITLLDKTSFKTKSFNDGVGDLKKGLIDLRAKTGQSFDVLNKGLFDLVSAGVDAEKAIETLSVATDLALAGATDASIAVDGLTSAMNAYGMEAEDARKVAEKFFTAQKFGKTTIAELSDDFGKVGAAANAMGISFDEVLASVSAATLAGIKTNEAYTGLKAVISNIVKPSKDAADEADKLGISFDSSALKAKGFNGFLKSITGSANFNSTSLEKLFGSMEAVNIILALTGAQAGDFNNILAELGDETKRTGTFQDALVTKSNTVDEQFKKLSGSADALKVVIGEKLSPAFGHFADNAADKLDYVRENMDDLELGIKRFYGTLLDLNMGFSQLITEAAGMETKNFTPINFDELPNSTQFDPNKIIADIEKVKEAELKASEAKQAAQFKTNKEKEEQEVIHQERLAEIKEEFEVQQALRKEELAAADDERKTEERERALELEDEQFAEDIERFMAHLSNKNAAEVLFSGLAELRAAKELKASAKTDKQKKIANEAFAKAEDNLKENMLNDSLDRLQFLVGEETAAGKAIFLIKKAQALQEAIVFTASAVTEALPNYPLAAAVGIAGGLQVATIAATAIQGVTGAQKGGLVPGLGRGDTVPYMLEPQEVIIPQEHSKTFSQLFGNFPDQQETAPASPSGEINISIGLSDEASQMLTVEQFEDSRIGVSR